MGSTGSDDGAQLACTGVKHWSKDGLHVVGVANSHADGRAIVSCTSRYSERLSRRLGMWFPGTCIKERQNGSAIVPSIYQLKRNR